jgi:hypothetical protein
MIDKSKKKKIVRRVVSLHGGFFAETGIGTAACSSENSSM